MTASVVMIDLKFRCTMSTKRVIGFVCEAFLAWNPNKLAKMKFAMNQDSISNAGIENQMYFNCNMFKECVGQRFLPPSLLYWNFSALFVSIGNKIDSKSKKSLVQ